MAAVVVLTDPETGVYQSTINVFGRIALEWSTSDVRFFTFLSKTCQSAFHPVSVIWVDRIEFRQWQLSGTRADLGNGHNWAQSGRRTGPVRMAANGAVAGNANSSMFVVRLLD